MSTNTGTYATPTASGSFLTALPTFLISLVFVVGLIVLMALHDITSASALPLIAVVAGVHTGAAVSSSTSG